MAASRALRRLLGPVAATALALGLTGAFAVHALALPACTDQFTGANSGAWEDAGNR